MPPKKYMPRGKILPVKDVLKNVSRSLQNLQKKGESDEEFAKRLMNIAKPPTELGTHIEQISLDSETMKKELASRFGISDPKVGDNGREITFRTTRSRVDRLTAFARAHESEFKNHGTISVEEAIEIIYKVVKKYEKELLMSYHNQKLKVREKNKELIDKVLSGK